MMDTDLIQIDPWQRWAFPIDISKVATLLTVGLPGADKDAVPMQDSTCPSCRARRRQDDWARTRETGQCSYPYGEPFIPTCPACQNRTPRLHEGHSYVDGECIWAGTNYRTTATRVHTPKPKTATVPHAGTTANRDGVELGQEE